MIYAICICKDNQVNLVTIGTNRRGTVGLNFICLSKFKQTKKGDLLFVFFAFRLLGHAVFLSIQKLESNVGFFVFSMTFLCCCVVTGTEKKWLTGDGDGASVYPEFIDLVIPIDTKEVEQNDSDCHSGKPSIWF